MVFDLRICSLPHIFPQSTLTPWRTTRNTQLIELEWKDRLKDAPRLKVIGGKIWGKLQIGKSNTTSYS